MAAHVWKIKTDWAPGWVREVYDGKPIMTGSEWEAHQFAARAEAQLAIDGFPKDRVRMQPVQSAPHTIEVHGDRPGGILGG